MRTRNGHTRQAIICIKDEIICEKGVFFCGGHGKGKEEKERKGKEKKRKGRRRMESSEEKLITPLCESRAAAVPIYTPTYIDLAKFSKKVRKSDVSRGLVNSGKSKASRHGNGERRKKEIERKRKRKRKRGQR